MINVTVVHDLSFYTVNSFNIIHHLQLGLTSRLFPLCFPNKEHDLQHYRNICSTTYMANISPHHDIRSRYLKPWNVRAEIHIEIASPAKCGSVFKEPSGALCNRVHRHPVEETATVTEHSSCRELGFHGDLQNNRDCLNFVPASFWTSLTKTKNLSSVGLKLLSVIVK
jgi:hypothetical protein